MKIRASAVHPRIGLLSPLLLLSITAFAEGAFVARVGTGPNCTHATIQAAIDDTDAIDPNDIVVTRSLTYTAQALQVDGKHFRMSGGYDTCAQTGPPSGSTTLSGAGGSHDSVMTFTGNDNEIVLEDLSIIRGDEVSDGYGGGIDFRSNGFLILRNTSVSQNYAGYGGGINVSATGGHASLQLESGTVILGNVAQYSGGGVRLWGDADLKMVEDNSQITANEAIGINPQSQQAQYGYGGGVELVTPADARIGSPGLGSNGVIFDNRARYGGGIAVMGEGNNAAGIAHLFTVDPARPVRVHRNVASQAGGGIYLQPNSGTGDYAPVFLCAANFRIDSNSAQEGAAIYSDHDDSTLGNDQGGFVFLNLPAFNQCTVDGSPCTAGTQCNSIDGNVAQTTGEAETTGATVLIRGPSVFNADRVQFRGNRGGQVLRMTHDGGGGTDDGDVSNCVIADNTVSGHLILADEGADVKLQYCTIANNAIDAADVIEGSDFVTLRRSIIDQPGKTSVTGASTVIAEHVLATEIASLGGEQFGLVVLDRPRFLDAEAGDYHQLAASRGVDFDLPDAGVAIDLDGMPRGMDVGFVPDWFGIGDVGAYERQSLMPIIRNSGFDAQMRQWSVLAEDSVTWIAEVAKQNGVIEIRQTDPPAAAVVGLSQCIHLPGPGAYRLNGLGRAIGGIRADYPSLVWTYRADADECTGPATESGELHLPRSSAFTSAVNPAVINAPLGQWTRNSTLEVALRVANGNATVNDGVDAFFDDISLLPLLDDTIFTDGFDG